MVASPAQKRQPKSQKPVYLYVPDYFSPQSHLSADRQHREQEAWYVLDLIVKRRITRRNAKDDYVPLLAQLLDLVLPKYNLLLEDLRRHGAIEWKDGGHYVEGRHARQYRLSPSMRSRYHAREVTDKALLRRIRAFRARESGQIESKLHKHLKKWAGRIEIDYDDACQTIMDKEQETGDDYSCQWSIINRIDREDTFLKGDDFGRRSHTPISGIAGWLRPHLHYQGNRLVNHDIRNSQPFFLGVLLSNVYSKTGAIWGSGDVTPFEQFNLPEKRNIWAPYPVPSDPLTSLSDLLATCFLPHSCKRDSEERLSGGEIRRRDEIKSAKIESADLPSSVKAYVRHTSEGTLYERLAVEAGCTRDEVKQRLFEETLFCKTEKEGALAGVVHTLYPHVMTGIRDMKKGKGKDRHKIAAMLLQRQESHIVLGRIATTLMLDHPTLPFWTIHDSILSPQEHSGTIQRVMRETFDQLGFCPTISIVDYGNL